MSLDRIKEAVLNASRTEAGHINAAAQKQASEKAETQKENLRKEFEYQFQARSRLIKEEYGRKLAQFQGNAAKELLEAKNDAMRAIFREARDMLAAWPVERYEHKMKQLLDRISEGRGGIVRIHGEEQGIFERIIRQINSERNAEGLKVDDRYLSEKGGFVFISENYEIDATIHTILREIELALLPEIARDLANI